MADAMNISPSPTPTTSGQPRRAATRISGLSRWATANAKWPSRRAYAARTASTRSPEYESSTRCAITSESVSEWYSWPASESSRRSVA